MIEISTDRKPICNFLLVVHCNYMPILWRFRNTTIYWSKIGSFSTFCQPQSHLKPLQGIPLWLMVWKLVSSSPAVAERPRDASSLSVDSFNKLSTIRRAQSVDLQVTPVKFSHSLGQKSHSLSLNFLTQPGFRNPIWEHTNITRNGCSVSSHNHITCLTDPLGVT